MRPRCQKNQCQAKPRDKGISDEDRLKRNPQNLKTQDVVKEPQGAKVIGQVDIELLPRSDPPGIKNAGPKINERIGPSSPRIE